MVCVVTFREDSEIVKKTGVNIGVTWKEQLYCRTAGDNDIEMWPSSVVMVTTGENREYNLDPDIKDRANLWAPVAWERDAARASRDMEKRRANRPQSSEVRWAASD